jgi:hypothetical protein
MKRFALAAAMALALFAPPMAMAAAPPAAVSELSAQKHDKGKGKAGPHRGGPKVHRGHGRSQFERAITAPPRAVIRGGRAVTRGVVQGTRGIVRGTRAALRLGPGPRVVMRTPPRYWRGWQRPSRIVIYRGPRRFWYDGGWRTFVPAATLGVFAVGAATYYADGYVSIPQPICTGPTADGCQLRWQEVPLQEGGSAFQCVQYCAQRDRSQAEVRLPDEPPPAAAKAPDAPPAAAPPEQQTAEAPSQRVGCELTIYSESEFKGSAAPTDEDQSDLSGDGWKDQIASLQIKSGTWDFFTGGEFDGEMMRLPPGSYPALDTKWSKHIGSFMCSAPQGS